ncbi:MAG: hypothetical protein B6D54_06165 [Epsilonproteobacteria bacterium 4484_65]|nr:MAG: hypothetical protein B6D54_06165 [Epsilonproteobacteria bacterium 4484_65]
MNIGNANRYLKWTGDDLIINGKAQLGSSNDYVEIGDLNYLCQIRFIADGVLQGRIFSLDINTGDIYVEAEDNLTLEAKTGGEVYIKANGESRITVRDSIVFYKSLTPYSDAVHDIGSSSRTWNYGYINTIYTDLLKPKSSTSDIGDSDNYFQDGYIDTLHVDLIKRRASTSDIGEFSFRFDNIYVTNANFCNANDYCSIVDLSEILPKPACKLIEELKVDNYSTEIGKHISHASWPGFVRNLKYVDVPADDKERLKEIKKLVSKQVGVYKKDGKTYITFEVSSINVSIVDSIIIAAIKELNDRLKILETKIN